MTHLTTAHKRQTNLNITHEAEKNAERIIYEDEWLDNVITKSKFVIEQLAKETFNRYREVGKIILESGYKKGQWNDKHKQKFKNSLGISQQPFSSMVQLGEMEEQEFVDIVNNFRTFRDWVHRGSIAKKAKHERQIQVIREAIKHLEPPKGKYDVIVVDPPWPVEHDYDPEHWRGASPYPEKTIEQLKDLNLPYADNCVLWLWTTNRFMHDAFHVLDAWGFEPKTILTWVKHAFSLGVYLRGQTEHCILAIKGTPNIVLTDQPTVLFDERKEHSEKPDKFYEMVDRLCPGWKLEYYARKKREGWEIYGTLEKER